jgi:hypothetical protein
MKSEKREEELSKSLEKHSYTARLTSRQGERIVSGLADLLNCGDIPKNAETLIHVRIRIHARARRKHQKTKKEDMNVSVKVVRPSNPSVSVECNGNDCVKTVTY